MLSIKDVVKQLVQRPLLFVLAMLLVQGVQAEDYLEESVVTATQREENIQDVPISITQLTGDRLNARFTGGGDILQLANAVPNLHIESSNGRLAPRFYLRGLGNADFTAAASQPVQWYLTKYRWKSRV